MAAKKDTGQSQSSPSDSPKRAPHETTRSGVDIIPADREVLNKDIDARMAALLKDHQAMGARPKTEPKSE